ncbi:hypothetical protein [Maridesulfovibrio hydrothermalis]|uniref:Uncharacterized protein n=1 Tax=Maridesulfovibrio hydrothermalis AM13 = DSM 14728 TaxID=1121451 RepID=L0RC03_9BACT|nr:hypothetical protein [Maridesulfovibrio hydrothermalis]CCO23752.1 protein of unknown function [Maridesulfovibrio hydrothermalis AM13 = DSM 14728]
MPLPNDVIMSLVDTCCQGANVSHVEKQHLIEISKITLNSFYDNGEIPDESYLVYLKELQKFCVTLSDEKEKIRKEWEQKVQAAKKENEEDICEVSDCIQAIAGKNKNSDVIRQILTAIVNCERKSVPEEFRNEFTKLQKALGLDRFLDN